MGKTLLYTTAGVISIFSLGFLALGAILPIAVLLGIRDSFKRRRYPWKRSK